MDTERQPATAGEGGPKGRPITRVTEQANASGNGRVFVEGDQPALNDGPLLAVRRRGAFLISAVLWAAAVGGIAVLAGYLVVVFNVGVDAGERVRRALGLTVPMTGPDWYLLGVMVLILLVPTALLWGLYLWYGRVWRRRLLQVWEDGRGIGRYSRLRPLKLQANAKERRQRAAYLSALVASPAWQGFVEPKSAPNAPPKQATNGTHKAPSAKLSLAASDAVSEIPSEMSAEEYRLLAERALREIEDDVVERAITTGLIVGLGPSRLDRATIVIAALEMQLHVLTRLGKRPSLPVWRELLKRTSASFFFNTYLEREDALIVAFTIRKMALGLEMTAELGRNAAEALSDNDDAEALDEALEGIGTIPMLGSVLKTTGSMAIGVGALGIQQVAELTREAGNELLQGAMAGGVLYYHGMAIAADALALDQAHRHSAPMIRTPRQGAMRTAVVAGQLLRGQVKRYRGAYRERHRALLRLATNRLPRRKRRTEEDVFVDTQAPEARTANESKRPSGIPWRLWRKRPEAE